jgi:chromosome segregation and condensation protein ScpB
MKMQPKKKKKKLQSANQELPSYRSHDTQTLETPAIIALHNPAYKALLHSQN